VRIESKAEQILNALGYTDTELSIVIVDDEEMSSINSEYRGIDSTTDVLSFPMHEGEFGDVCPELLGDVVISAPTALLMSRQHDCSLEAVLDLLLVHGILHLIGHDHETGEEDSRLMEEKTFELLEMLGHSKETLGWYTESNTE
jgi:probable rRNA maturation factor